MATTIQAAKVSEEVLQELSSTEFACSSLKPLSGGTANFIFKGTLTNPLSDGTKELAVKHGEGFIASMPDFQIPTTRCVSPGSHADPSPLFVTDGLLARRSRMSEGAEHAAANLGSVCCSGS